MDEMTKDREAHLERKLFELFKTEKVTVLEMVSMGFMFIQEARERLKKRGMPMEQLDEIFDQAYINTKTGKWEPLEVKE